MNGYNTKETSLEDTQSSYDKFKRVNYFHGMLMTVWDFKTEQRYHNEKRKLWNRKLHGWGVVCGLNVKATDPESSKIVITPGMALDDQGNEIWVHEDYKVDLAGIDLEKTTVLCPDASKKGKEPSTGMEGNEETNKYYITIKYNETPADPKQGYAPENGDDENGCTYSRMEEEFCVKLFKIPSSASPEDKLVAQIVDCLQADTPFECLVEKTLPTFQAPFNQQPYPCPTCRCDGEPYVILGTLDLQETDGKITTISQEMISVNEGRRYVATSPFWQRYLGAFFAPIAAFKKKAQQEIADLKSFTEDLNTRLLAAETDIEDLKKKHVNYNRILALSIGAFILAVIVIIWIISQGGQ